VVTCAGESPCTGWLAGTNLAGHLGIGIDHACATAIPSVFAAGDVTCLRAGGTKPGERRGETTTTLGSEEGQGPRLLTQRGIRTARLPAYLLAKRGAREVLLCRDLARVILVVFGAKFSNAQVVSVRECCAPGLAHASDHCDCGPLKPSPGQLLIGAVF
jgi:hypothetical protein